jgi:hypothetical protein
MFESTRQFTLFDYFRVPYTSLGADAEPVAGVASLHAAGDGPRLFWCPAPASRWGEARPGSYVAAGIPIFGAVVPDAAARNRLARLGGSWHVETPICDPHGTPVASIWRRADGSVFLPFDPDEIITAYWSERYKALIEPLVAARLQTLARRSYYHVRPFLPRSTQMVMRRSFSRVQAKSRFPRWPIETALHDFYGLLFALLAEIAGEPVPTLAAWPRGLRWALVLTHDVEGPAGFANLLRLLQVELRRGYRSVWNFVPHNGYSVEESFVEELRASGFEVGVHGLFHDGRDITSLRERLPRIRHYAERWQANGFRSPGTHRSWDAVPLLGFDYDSSYSDTAPYEPQPGGCCTWLPFMIKDVVELPITLPQDHTVFELLGHVDASLWIEKTLFLREQGGMALMLTHPDYIDNPRLFTSYVDFLEQFADDDTAWRALPGEVSAWWRRRSESTLRKVDGEWSIDGPARDATVELISRPGEVTSFATPAQPA